MVHFFALRFYLFFSCGGSGGADDAVSRTGSVSFALNWEDTAGTRALTSRFRAMESPNGDVCVDFEIAEIAADIYNSSGSVAASDIWPCSAHEGTLEEVQEGSNMSILIKGLTASGVIGRIGQVGDITVVAGQNTDAGKIEMHAWHDNQKPPEVIESTPADGDTNVYLDSRISVTFDEEIILAFINNSTFSCQEQSSSNKISGTINETFDIENQEHKFIFLPLSPLTPLTTYVVTIAKTVENLLNNKMEEDYIYLKRFQTFGTKTATRMGILKRVQPSIKYFSVNTGTLNTPRGTASLKPLSMILSVIPPLNAI
jgi:hypothetical protein